MIKINLNLKTQSQQISNSTLYKFLTLISIIIILIISGSFVFAQSSKAQLVCRDKAKEAAKIAYSNCMSDAKEAELDKIRSDYKNKMDQLKNYYDKRIKNLSPSDDSTDNIDSNSLNSTSLNKKTQAQSLTAAKGKQKKTKQAKSQILNEPKYQLPASDEQRNSTVISKENIIEVSQPAVAEQSSVKNLPPNHPLSNPILPYNDKEEREVSTGTSEIPAPEIHDSINEDFR